MTSGADTVPGAAGLATGQAHSTSPRRVLHLIHGATFSGAEQVLLLLTRHIDRSRYEVVVACLEDGLLRRRLVETGTRVHCLGTAARFPASQIRGLVRLIRSQGIALVVNHTARTNLLGRICARLAGVPNLTVVHSSVLRDTNSRSLRWGNFLVEHGTARLSKRFVAVNQRLREEVVRWGFPRERVVTIYNGVDPALLAPRRVPTPFRQEQGIPVDAPLVGMVASFRPRKGAEVLLSALPHLLAQVPRARCALVGHGEWVRGLDYLEELRSRAADLGVLERVHFTGFQGDAAAALAALDLLVVPSLFGEGCPMVVLEAMALGVPVVASRTEGNEEIVVDGVTGMLVEPRDPEALARGMAALLHDREHAQALGETARKRVQERFLADRMARDHCALYDRILGPTTAGGVNGSERP